MLDTSTATTSFDEARRNELAAFLKSRRATISPARVGLRAGVRRRAPGLLREEVAQLAGISAAWYVWLEQGRDIHPSADVVANLADALLLSDAERAHLFALARPPHSDGVALSREAPAALRAFIAGLTNQPAYVVNGLWDVLAWNDAALELFGDFELVPMRERNVLRMIFCWSPWRTLLVDWSEVAASATAQFRAATACYSGHPQLVELLVRMNSESREFADLWRAGAVNEPRVYSKRLRHPRLGVQTLTYAPLKPQGTTDDLSVMVYSPTLSG